LKVQAKFLSPSDRERGPNVRALAAVAQSLRTTVARRLPIQQDSAAVKLRQFE
jgi:hypothetical protein